MVYGTLFILLPQGPQEEKQARKIDPGGRY